MISRVAETCFWMHRQIERADAMARLLRVNRAFVLDAPIPDERKWYPLLVVCGEHERFAASHTDAQFSDEAAVQEYLTWDTENPVSIASALYWARENARTIREVITLDMWTVLNDLWHFIRGGAGRRKFKNDPDAFYRRISDAAAMFQGVCDNTMLRDAAFDFMRLGMSLERAGQTARVLDVHHHTFDPDAPGEEGEAAPASGALSDEDEGAADRDAVARLQWLAMLKSCSASHPFIKRTRAVPTRRGAVAFLVLDPRFPRSVAFCLDEARTLLAGLRSGPARGEASWSALVKLEDSLKAHTQKTLAAAGTHGVLTRIVEGTAEIAALIHADYFDPVVRVPATPSGGAAA